ncbi:MULTIPLE ORGANELLAR RNA EDITING FACTOR 1 MITOCHONDRIAL [Salix purpurea]|uniref:MULTIPLE ORGANELLAR RNA EDITING FACTOR 1 MITOCHONDRIAL n=1 Tax=Salix purpurea TaxID=77065 RepID=A0A9Q0TGN7_SALPP|nr:MULTIPLE ORGANELLAR RNA EDITING FACTOR 1 MITOCHONDRIAL [Salix purpurea]
MYACSTTIYQGFQVSITQQEAEKFKGVPGVVFVSPDSRVNKENGGDKYKNGAITPRPTPVQYQRGGESRRDPGIMPLEEGTHIQDSKVTTKDSREIMMTQTKGPFHKEIGGIMDVLGKEISRGDNWNDSPTHGGNYGLGGSTSYGKQHPGEGQRSAQLEQRGMQGEQGNYAPVRQPGLSNQFSQQGYMQRGGDCHGSSQNSSPQQDHGPPGLGGRTPMNNRDYASGGRNMYPGQHGNHYPPGQQGYFQEQQENYYPPGQQGYFQGQQGNHYPPGQQVYFQEQQENYYPPGQQGYNQGWQNYNQGQQGYFQGQQGNHYGPDQRTSTQGDWRDHGSPGQRDYRGDNWNYSPTHGGNYGQGENTSYGQLHPGEGKRSAQMEQMGMQGEQGDYAPLGPQGWSNHLRRTPIK